jgi:proteasome lid subunit RPN8/RPN11
MRSHIAVRLPAICRPEMVVGWYHSHPGFGCWLSGVDINTQQSFEALNQRAVAVVVDPIQSVKGKVHEHCWVCWSSCRCATACVWQRPPS